MKYKVGDVIKWIKSPVKNPYYKITEINNEGYHIFSVYRYDNGEFSDLVEDMWSHGKDYIENANLFRRAKECQRLGW